MVKTFQSVSKLRTKHFKGAALMGNIIYIRTQAVEEIFERGRRVGGWDVGGREIYVV